MDIWGLRTACLLGIFAGRLFSQVPALGFEENKGQYPQEILYASRSGAYVTSTAFVLAPMQASMQFENASPGVQPRPGDALAGQINVIGAGATIMGIRQYAGVQWTGVYPGVDAALVVSANTLFLRFNLAAGASISPLRIKVSGIASLMVEDRGSLDAGGLRYPVADGRDRDRAIRLVLFAGERPRGPDTGGRDVHCQLSVRRRGCVQVQCGRGPAVRHVPQGFRKPAGDAGRRAPALRKFGTVSQRTALPDRGNQLLRLSGDAQRRAKGQRGQRRSLRRGARRQYRRPGLRHISWRAEW